MVTLAAERKAVAHLADIHGMSERRACKAIGCCRMTIRYQSTRPDDTALRERMRAITREPWRFVCYRRLHAMLKREGLAVNLKKLFRLYGEEKPSVCRRGGRKRAIRTRAPMPVPMGPNERWSLAFISDQFTDGAASVCLQSWTIVRAKTWLSWQIHRYRGYALPGSLTGSSRSVAGRK